MTWLAVMTAFTPCVIAIGVLTRTALAFGLEGLRKAMAREARSVEVATDGRSAQEGNMRSMAVVLALILVALFGQTGAARAVVIGGACAGAAGRGCDAGLWCEIEPGGCSRADAEGRCVRAPQRCGLSFRPVCACGGQTFRSDCVRERAKAQKAHDGPCR